MTTPYTVTKTLTGYSTAHRAWPATSHCRFVHGYDRTFTFTIEGHPDPTTGFVYDFGDFKPIKTMLAEQFDHTLIVSPHDPDLATFEQHDGRLWQLRVMDHPGMEGAARWAFEQADPIIKQQTGGRARLIKVEARENDRNAATYHQPDNQR